MLTLILNNEVYKVLGMQAAQLTHLAIFKTLKAIGMTIEQIDWSAANILQQSADYSATNIPDDGIVKEDVLRMLESMQKPNLQASMGNGVGVSDSDKKLASKNLEKLN